ncbi:hypothetical protein, partial [uncultured Robinsoniella sp.]|uniref:hypothetical protein n=1 Tax=uncultured Robinsoniella sp. TaxID=904190 RepID=UPI00374F02F9
NLGNVNNELNAYNKRFDDIETNLGNVNNELNAYNKRFDDIENHFGNVNCELNAYNKRFDDIENHFGNVNCELNAYNKRFDDIENLVRANYKMTEDFYISQKEVNTELFDQIAIISGELEMHNNQISKNTADLRRYI